MADDHTTDWRVVVLATLAGIVAAMQIGKVAPAVPAIRAELGMSLVTAGWMLSIFNLMAALLALVAGILADRLVIRWVIAAAVAMLLAGTLAGALAGSSLSLIASRAVAGLGLVGIAVAAPRMIVGASAPRDRSLTLGVWSIYMPTGIALGMLLTPLLLGWLQWRGVWLANAGLLSLFLLLFLAAVRGGGRTGSRHHHSGGVADLRQVTHVPGPWLLGAIFACYTVPFFAMMSWFPVFLIETQGLATASAGAFGALVVAANGIGCLASAWLLHHGARRWRLQFIAFGVMALCAVGVFSSLVGPAWKTPLAFLFSAVGGLIPSATLSAASLHAPDTRLVATVNGIIVQGANTGSLFGPPLMAMAVGLAGGWIGTWWLTLLFTGAGIGLVLWLRAVEARLQS